MHYNLYTQKSPPVRILWEPCTIYTHRNPHQSESCENRAPFIHTEIPYIHIGVRTWSCTIYTHRKSATVRFLWESCTIYTHRNPLQSESRKDLAPFIHREIPYSQSPVKTMHHLYTQKSPTVRVLCRPCTIYTHRNALHSESCKDHAPFIHTETPYSQSPVKTMHHLYTQKSHTVRVL